LPTAPARKSPPAHPFEHRRFDEKAAAVFPDPLAAKSQLGAIATPRVDVAQYAIHLKVIDNGTQPCGRIQRIARLHRAAERLHLLQHRVLDALLHQQP
jgi:hypothetical protein